MQYKIINYNGNSECKIRFNKDYQLRSNQTYRNFEHIIKDGYSTDGTKEMDFNGFDNTYFHKIKDIGIYDAMNQGFEFAKGDLIIFLNAGDILFETIY